MATNELNTQLLCRLECPVCFETCLPPIYMCVNGHPVCSKCQPKLKKCGTCRAPGKQTARCVPLESIAELIAVPVPCPNQPHGCLFKFKLTDMDTHLKKCGFKCRICPEWMFTSHEMKLHVMQKHPTHYIQIGRSGKVSMQTHVKIEYVSDMDSVVFNGEIFWVDRSYTPSTRTYSIVLRIVSHDVCKALQYSYSVLLKSKNTENSYSVSHRANVLMETAAYEGEMEIVLPKRIVDEAEDGWLNYRLKISIVPEKFRDASGNAVLSREAGQRSIGLEMAMLNAQNMETAPMNEFGYNAGPWVPTIWGAGQRMGNGPRERFVVNALSMVTAPMNEFGSNAGPWLPAISGTGQGRRSIGYEMAMLNAQNMETAHTNEFVSNTGPWVPTISRVDELFQQLNTS